MNTENLRILVGAYACHPLQGSEPGVGWSWVRGLAKHCRLDVITADHRGSRNAIEEICAKEQEFAQQVRFHFLPDFVDEAWTQHPFLMRYFQPIYYRYYRRWMWSAYERAQSLAASEHFDLVHQLTMIGYREPGYLWKLPLPFVWGPIGGTQNAPWSFIPSLGLVEGGRHAARNLVNAWQFRTQRRFHIALRRADALITTASDTQARLRKQFGCESIVIPASFSMPEHPLARVRQLRPHEDLRLVFSGMHISLKAFPYVLRALAALRGQMAWRLEVIGAGVMTGAWKRESERLGLSDRIHWHGQVTRDRALEIMSAADVFLFTSLKEGSPAVIAESLSLGLPVLSAYHHGMADYIDDSCGIGLSVRSPAAMVQDLAAALAQLTRRDPGIERLSRGALARARVFSAETQIPRVLNVYRDAIRHHASRYGLAG